MNSETLKTVEREDDCKTHIIILDSDHEQQQLSSVQRPISLNNMIFKLHGKTICFKTTPMLK